MTISMTMTWATEDQGQSSSLLTKIVQKHGPPRKEGEKMVWAARGMNKENEGKGAERSRLNTQNGSRVSTLDVSRVEAQD